MRFSIAVALFLLPAASTLGQTDDMGGMPGMNGMPQMPTTGVLGNYPIARDSSGTSWQPDNSAHDAVHLMTDDWILMAHMMLFGVYDSQSGPRGADKAFLEGMLMGAARRDLDNGDSINLRAMLSPDPLIGRDGYPLLLASGETADGATPLIDRQHPHDLIMELSGSYAHRFDGAGSIFLYAADPGEPALGPPAFMHRPSGMDIADAPITHHWLDSTHIVFGVVTGGLIRDAWKVEVSQFTGREPDQFRYDFDPVRLDSTSVRASWNPAPQWSLQISWGHLVSPEQLAPKLNENRSTASATNVTKFGDDSSLAVTLAWGLKQESDGTNLNGLLLESEFAIGPWVAFARGEWEENSELDTLGRVVRVGELTIGGIHDWPIAEHLKLGLGALYAFDFVPSAILPPYGDNPHGAMGFMRLATR